MNIFLKKKGQNDKWDRQQTRRQHDFVPQVASIQLNKMTIIQSPR